MSRDGVRVGGGRLRVDAARAVAKLREYQLPDPIAWAHEVVRAAVLFGARELFVEADADDVWIAWSGAPLPEQDLARLFDDLVGGGKERRAQRLLATGVNTALALDPRFVDVWSLGPRPGRVRYTPHLYRVSDEGRSEALRALAVEHAPRPEAAVLVSEGGLVHVRRALDGGLALRLFTGRTPPEVGALLSACRSLRIPLHATPRPAPARPPRVRVELPASAGLRGHAEIVSPEEAHGSGVLAWCELGVVLAAEPLKIAAREGARLPLRVTIDHDRLPTNAARSAVRDDEPLVEEARRAALGLASELVKALAAAIVEAATAEDHALHLALRTAAIAILAGVPSRKPFPESIEELPAWAAPLADVPILRDALGRARTASELARAGVGHAYRGTAPVRAELAPFLGDVPWMPLGDPAYRLFGDEPPADAAPLVVQAEARARARLTFLDRPELDHRFPLEAQDLAVATFERAARGPEQSWADPGALDIAGLEGRVAIRAPSALAQGSLEHGEITLLVLRRPIERLRVACELPLRAVVTAGTLRANASYGGLADRDAVQSVVLAVLAAAVRAGELLAASLGGGTASVGGGVTAELGPATATTDRASLEAAVRATMRTALRAQHERRVDDEALRALTVRGSPLGRAPVFRPWSGPPLTLAELKELAATGRVLGAAPAAVVIDPATPPPVEGRLVLRLSRPDAEALPLLCGSRMAEQRTKKGSTPVRLDTTIHVVHYGAVPGGRARSAALLSSLAGARTFLSVEEPGFCATLAVLELRRAAELQLRHAGAPIRGPFPWRDAPTGLVLATDDDALVPRADGAGLADTARLGTASYDARRWCERFCAAAAAHLSGAPVSGFVTSQQPLELLLEIARIGALPGGPATLAELPVIPDVSGQFRPFAYFRLAGAGRAGFVTPEVVSPGLRAVAADLVAMVLDAPAARSLGELFETPVVDKSAEAQARLEAARREQLWQVLLRRSAAPSVAMPSDAVEVRGPGLTGWARPAISGQERLTLLTAGRLLEERSGDGAGGAMDARIEVERELVDVERGILDETGTSRVKGALRDARRRLVLARFAGGFPIEEHEALAALGASFVAELPARAPKPMQEAMDRLLDAPVFPLLSPERGARTSIRAAIDEGAVRLTHGLPEWLGPVGRPHALDRGAVLAFPEPLEADVTPWVLLARRLVSRVATPRDVTKEARRLLEARRVQQEGQGRATMPAWVDRRFVVSLAALAERSVEGPLLSEVLPDGEAALVAQGQTRLLLVGREARTLHYAFVPTVFVVARSPYEAELDEPEAKAKLEAAVRAVVAETLRWTADHVPEEHWPPAVRSGVRRSALLGGRTHLERLAKVPLFLTTAGTSVSYERLREEVNRFGALWVVSDPDERRLPVDPLRSALVLTDSERAQLHPILPTDDGERQLALDQELRENLARPPVVSIAPTAAQRAWAIDAAERPISGGRAWVLPLTPAAAAQRGLHTFIGGRPLGPAADGARWPTLALVDSTELSPDRVHGAPAEDHALLVLQEEVSQIAEELLMARLSLARAGEFPVLVDAALSRDALGTRGFEVRGHLHWSGVGPPGEVSVEDEEGSTSVGLAAVALRELAPRRVPLAGTLWIAGRGGLPALPDTLLQSLARKAYSAIVAQAIEAAGDVGERGELARAALVQAAILGQLRGHLPKKKAKVDAWAREPLELLAGSHRSLADLSAALEQRRPVLVIDEAERAAAQKLDGDPIVLVRSTSLAGRVAVGLLAEHAVTLREHLRLDEPPAPPPASVRPPKATEKLAEPKARAAPSVRPAPSPSAAELLARHVGAAARAVDPSTPSVRIEGRRVSPLIGREKGAVVLAAGSTAVRIALARPETFARTAPLLALEVLGADDENAIARFLRSLGD